MDYLCTTDVHVVRVGCVFRLRIRFRIFVQPTRVSFRLYLLLFVLVYAGARTFEGPGFPVYLSVYIDHADTAQFGGKFPGNAFIQFRTGS